jgi:membrane protein DedA with SNARE-associated domain/rhodanese-related sulfurtransferase
METLLDVIGSYGLWVVFFAVLLDQGGLPFPAYPALIVTAARAPDSGSSVVAILVVAIGATLIADLLWFGGGRRFGTALLQLMCKVSLSPESCVGSTRRLYGRWGAPSLIVAKYIPGFAAVATTLAGQAGTSMRRFVFFDAIGAALWASGGIAVGVIFHEAVEVVLVTLEAFGSYAVILLLAAVALFIAVKWWQRQRFLMRIRMARISSEELGTLLESQQPITILDVRTPARRAATGWIPGSIHVADVAALEVDPNVDVILYCDCPSEASAAVAAKKLQERGFARVRPLSGGLDAWRERGYRVEQAGGEVLQRSDFRTRGSSALLS